MAIDYRDKIRKLLALAESPVEAEARAALLKARDLMTEHKISMIDLKEVPKGNVIEKETDVCWGTRKNPWICDLASTIGVAYCCQAIGTRQKGKQTRKVSFLGFEEDASVCDEIFRWTVRCILDDISVLRKKYKGLAQSLFSILSNSYGRGYVESIRVSFEKQNEATSYALALSIPQEVKEKMTELRIGSENIQSSLFSSVDRASFEAGKEEGLKFDPKKKLKSQKEEGDHCA